MSSTACPACGNVGAEPLIERDATPVFLNQTYSSRAEASRAATGRMRLMFCAACGFGFNRAFDPAIANYGQEYDNDVSHSPGYVEHLTQMARRTLERLGTKNGLIVEVGCGQGHFLRKLRELEGHDGLGLVGYDPAYRGGEPPGSVELHARAFDPASVAELQRPLDLLVSRHVIEHMPDPLGFLRAILQCVESDRPIPVLLETPSFEWIVENRAFFDVFYEHCNYFSEASMQTVCRRAGLQVTATERVFRGQYQWIAGRPGAAPGSIEPGGAELRAAVHGFAADERRMLDLLRERIAAARRTGAVALWGAAAKGVTLANLIDRDAELIDCLIDVNPAKQGRFAPCSAHPIVSAAQAASRGVKTAFAMNPNYLDEMREMARETSPDLAVLAIPSDIPAESRKGDR